MRAMKSMLTLGSALVVAGATGSAQAVDIFFGDNASAPVDNPAISLSPDATSGSLYVLVNTDPEGYAFDNGSLGVSVSSSASGVINITGATVFNPSFFGGFAERWTSTSVVGAGPDGVDELLGLAVGSAGLDGGLPAEGENGDPNFNANGDFVFAKIDYDVIGSGSTILEIGEIGRQGDFLAQGGVGDVSGDVAFGTATISVIPEPASLALLGLGGVALLGRRRHA